MDEFSLRSEQSRQDKGADRRPEIWALVKRIYGEFSDDRIPTVADGITFFVLLALFPAISATISIIGLFDRHMAISRELDLVSGFLPGGAVSVLSAELKRLSAQKPGTLNAAFFISFAVALWSASGGYKALVEGLNVAFEVPERRTFLRQTLNALIFTVAGVSFAAVAIAAGLAIPEHPSPFLKGVISISSWPLLFAGCMVILGVIYRFGPNRPHTGWRWLTWGGATASLLWVGGTQAFTWYVNNFGSYNLVYGDLGAAVGFLTWVWLSLVVLLLGAEINCELERKSAIIVAEQKPPV